MPAQSPLTLTDQAFSSMRDMIVEGELAPGEWLRKRNIAHRLSMSSTPVREAIRRLQHEGLVEIQPKWGARVKTWTVAEIAQLGAMRAVLEGLSARLCAEVLSHEQIENLREAARAVDELDRTFQTPDALGKVHFGALFQEDMRFHLRLADEAGMSLLKREIERLRVLNATCRAWIRPLRKSVVTHEKIVDAIASHDGDRAEKVMRSHIESNRDHYLRSLREKFGDNPIISENNGATDNWQETV